MLDPKQTIALYTIKDRSLEAGEKLVSGLPYISCVDDVTLMLRDGELMASFVVEGLNADTSDGRQTAELSESLARFIAQQRAHISYYINRISVQTKPSISAIEGQPFLSEVNNRWQDYLQTIGLHSRITMVTIIMRPPSQGVKLWHLFGKQDDNYCRNEVLARANKLNKLLSTCLSLVSAAKPRRLTISEGHWLGLLRTMIDGSSGLLVPGRKFVPIADLLASSTIKFKGDVFESEGPSAEQKKYGTVISLKDYPIEAYPGILDNLNLPYDTVVTQSFTPINNVTAQSKICRVRSQMKAAEDAAHSLLAQLEDAEDDVASGRTIFGDHHCSIVVFCTSMKELELAANAITRAMQTAGAAIVREAFSARAVYFAQHPGNFSYRARPAMISSHNFAHLCALHGSPQGHEPERCPWGDAITTMPTARGETFRFNFHLAGKYGDRVVGHSLVLGQTGSGKTLGTAFLLCQAQRLNARVIIFDKDNGFEMAVRAMGGDYSSVQIGVDTHFNPFRIENDVRGGAWLSDWLAALANNEGEHLTGLQIQALEDATKANMSADPRLQNFEQFRSQLRSTDDDGDIYNRLARWTDEGQFGWLFSGKGEDPLSFNNKITAFDLSEIFNNDMIRTAWLSYVFRRIERLVEDEYPTLIVLDEAWKLLDDPYFEKRLKDWMLTMRKKNVVVILLTQRVAHIVNSAAGDAIFESAVSRLVYPNAYNTDAELAPLNLTPIESDFLKSSNVDNHLVLYKSGSDSVVLDFDLGALGGALDVLGGGHGEKGPQGWRDNPEFYLEMM